MWFSGSIERRRRGRGRFDNSSLGCFPATLVRRWTKVRSNVIGRAKRRKVGHASLYSPARDAPDGSISPMPGLSRPTRQEASRDKPGDVSGLNSPHPNMLYKESPAVAGLRYHRRVLIEVVHAGACSLRKWRTGLYRSCSTFRQNAASRPHCTRPLPRSPALRIPVKPIRNTTRPPSPRLRQCSKHRGDPFPRNRRRDRISAK